MPGTEIKEMQSWVELCRAFVACTDGPPYIDSSYDDLGDCPLLREDEQDEEAVRAYQHLCEELLADGTADLGLRFAILYPLRQGAMANPYPSQFRPKFSALREVFLTLAGLCNSEQLAGVRELKFELHNSYLAEQWDRGAQLFRRLSLLGLMSPTELQGVRGQYLFLSVWGRRIEWELWHSLQTDPDDNYECFWPKSHDFERLQAAFSALTHPELIEPGSHSHWPVDRVEHKSTFS